MKLFNLEEFGEYIKGNFECILESDEDKTISQQMPSKCDFCKRDVFLQIHARSLSYAYNSMEGLPAFINILI